MKRNKDMLSHLKGITGTDHDHDNLVDNSEEFRPERWSPEAVEGRNKGMKKEIIDHSYLKDLFSHDVFLYSQL